MLKESASGKMVNPGASPTGGGGARRALRRPRTPGLSVARRHCFDPAPVRPRARPEAEDKSDPVCACTARGRLPGLEDGVCDRAPRGLGGEPQARPAPVARGRPEAAAVPPQAPARTARPQRAAAGYTAESGLGHRLPVRRDRGAPTQDGQRRRRVPPRTPGYPGRAAPVVPISSSDDSMPSSSHEAAPAYLRMDSGLRVDRLDRT